MKDPIGRTPPGYVVHRIAGTWLVLDALHAPELVRLRLADAELRRSLFAGAPRRGRGSTPAVSLDTETSIILRNYRHGGLFARITRSLLLGSARAISELQVSARAEGVGAPVPHVMCLVLWPVFGPFWSAVIGTREERQTRDLLEEFRALCDSAAERERLSRAVGSAIRKLHDAGVEHRDLQLRNILVAAEKPPRIVVVDLDRAVFHRRGVVPSGRRSQNLGRLMRSVVKAGLWGREIRRREIAAFATGYLQGNRRLRGELRGWLPRERLKLAVHRLSYRFRPSSEPRPEAAPPRPA